LSDAARAGITLSRCSYRGLEPTYQVGEGAYTKIPVRSHALFPVALYEFVWAQQLWGLSAQVEPYPRIRAVQQPALVVPPEKVGVQPLGGMEKHFAHWFDSSTFQLFARLAFDKPPRCW
jgi:hypothetical protein